MLKFFVCGRKEKKEQVQQKQTLTPQKQTLAQQQKRLAYLSSMLAMNKEILKERSANLRKEENKFKEMAATGQRIEAERQYTVFKTLKEEHSKTQKLVTIIEKAILQLKGSMETNSMLGALDNVNKTQKVVEMNSEQIEEVLMDRREREQERRENLNIIDQMLTGTEEERTEFEEAYRQIRREAFEEEAMRVNAQGVNVNMQRVQNANGIQNQKNSKRYQTLDLQAI